MKLTIFRYCYMKTINLLEYKFIITNANQTGHILEDLL